LIAQIIRFFLSSTVSDTSAKAMVKKQKKKNNKEKKEEEVLLKEVDEINTRGQLQKKHALERKNIKFQVTELKRIRLKLSKKDFGQKKREEGDIQGDQRALATAERQT